MGKRFNLFHEHNDRFSLRQAQANAEPGNTQLQVRLIYPTTFNKEMIISGTTGGERWIRGIIMGNYRYTLRRLLAFRFEEIANDGFRSDDHARLKRAKAEVLIVRMRFSPLLLITQNFEHITAEVICLFH